MNTTNYGLYLTDDSSTRFYDWRKQINGTSDSNMIKIDTVLGNKADNSISVVVTLAASGWEGESSPYSQTITVENLGASQNGSIGLAQNATPTQINMAMCAFLRVSNQAKSQLTIIADGVKPTIDIPVCITLLG